MSFCMNTEAVPKSTATLSQTAEPSSVLSHDAHVAMFSSSDISVANVQLFLFTMRFVEFNVKWVAFQYISCEIPAEFA